MVGSGVARGEGEGGHLPPFAEFFGRQIEVGTLCNYYEI